MTTTAASISSRNSTSMTRAARCATVAVAFVVLLAVSFVIAQIPATAAQARPSSDVTLVVRPNWGHCSTPGVPC